jgi:hypothetical protein
VAIDDYLNRIPSQHRQKPRYMATVEALRAKVNGTLQQEWYKLPHLMEKGLWSYS